MQGKAATDHMGKAQTDAPHPGAAHVTIIMATRNGGRHLREQLASIAAQTHRNWTLYVSDDGSTDDTRQILKDFGQRHPLHLVEGPRRGAAANFLSALSQPDLPKGVIALADQDDVWLKGKLARGLRRMAAAARVMGNHDAPVLYAAESMLSDHQLTPKTISRSGRVRPAFAPSLAQNLFAGHSIMLSPAALALVRQARGTEAVIWHDWWLYQLLAGAGAGLVLDPTPLVIYRQHGGNAIGAPGGAVAGIRRMQMVLGGEWRRTIAAHTATLSANEALLTPEARQILAAFHAAPGAGPGRIRQLRALGIRRSSRMGDLLLASAALIGRL
ncbi:glycosyltransferase [Xinfangfangia sp. D13-10-4-6]|uniref:glycosyltransferase n=1 Tax=Pseudogemmobacter hezensis TaxID=2737662 RepID=UPI001551D681|nr:glycosyltransferase [Pseudogemmobacter hezensis]NPD14040.1 glycosyltransferase [Pseudogemmobacter hezensis]